MSYKTINASVWNGKMNSLATKLGLGKTQVLSFDLLAGSTCPKASLCHAWVTEDKDGNRELHKGKHMAFLCYAAKIESCGPRASVYRRHKSNTMALYACNGDIDKMAQKLQSVIRKTTRVIRIHSSGDFFSPFYFAAWCKVASDNPNIVFFAYTKILSLVLSNHPDNLHLVYSYGGQDDATRDKLAEQGHHVPTCYVTTPSTTMPGIPVACKSDKNDDYGYILAGQSFQIYKH